MAHVVDDTCVKCGACIGTGPTGCITEGDAKVEVDAAQCVDCAACEGVCPTGAIHA